MKTNQVVTTSVFFFTAMSCSLTAALAQTVDTAPSSGEPAATDAAQSSAVVASEETAAAAPVTPNPVAPEQAAPPAAPTAAPQTQPLPPAPAAATPPVRVPGRGLRIAGASVLAGGYGVSLIMGIVALDFGASEGGYYLIPLAGGYVMGGKVISGSEGGDGAFSLFMLTALPSIVQTAGLIILFAGLGKAQKWKEEQAAKTTVSFVPVGPGGTPGLSVSGVF